MYVSKTFALVLLMLLILTGISYAQEVAGGTPLLPPDALGMVTQIYTIVGVFKRFIPDSMRSWVNPVLAVTLGIGFSFYGGGTAGLIPIIYKGLIGAGMAMGTYSGPKYAGQQIGTQ